MRHTAALLLILALTGCTARAEGRTVLTVVGATSLTAAFAEAGAAYHTANPHVSVRFSAASSTDMAERMQNHGQTDVLAATGLDDLTQYVAHARTFAHDSMTIAVPTGNPRRIRNLDDLAEPRLRVVLGGPDIPVGRYTRQVLGSAGIEVRPRSEEADDDAVLARVRTRAADAAIVYLADARSAGVSVTSVPIPRRQNVTVTYVAATVRGGGHAEAARAFVDWLATPAAAALMRKYGFA